MRNYMHEIWAYNDIQYFRSRSSSITYHFNNLKKIIGPFNLDLNKICGDLDMEISLIWPMQKRCDTLASLMV